MLTAGRHMSRVTLPVWIRRAAAAGMLGCTLFTVGCATTPAGIDNSDPWEPFNRKVYAFNDAIDKHVLTPVANAYMEVTPRPVQASVSKFYNNLTYPNVFINDFLQGKVGLGISDTCRFVVNSTIGILGLFDPAKHLGLPAHFEDTGQSLAVWGVHQGPYVVVPFIGPDTVRNTPNLITSTVTNALFYVTNFYITIPLSVLGVIDTRVQAASSVNVVNQAALDPYIFVREGYLQHREFLIFDGHPPQHFYEDMDNGDADDSDAPPPKRDPGIVP